MRPAPGKDALIVLDHVGNVIEHGLPSADREWTLDGALKRTTAKRTAGASLTWRCGCGCMDVIGTIECQQCGDAKPGARVIKEIEGDLVETTDRAFAAVRTMNYRDVMRSRLSYGELREFARARGYKPGWAWHRWREQRSEGAAA